jgi:hypothetical protein
MEKEGNAKSFPKKKQLQTPNVQDIFPVIHKDSDERRHRDFVAGNSFQYNLCKNDQVRCQKCGTQFRELCVSVASRKQLLC